MDVCYSLVLAYHVQARCQVHRYVQDELYVMQVIRARVGTRTGASRVSNSAGMTTAASPTTLSLSASSSFRLLESSAVLSNLPLHEEQQKLLRQLHASIEETRDVANPRFLILCNIARPWMWTFVFLRSYDRLRQGLHRLYPAAVQVVLDRRVQPKPRLIMVDDFTVRSDIQARFKSRVLTMLGPLLKVGMPAIQQCLPAELALPGMPTHACMQFAAGNQFANYGFFSLLFTSKQACTWSYVCICVHTVTV